MIELTTEARFPVLSGDLIARLEAVRSAAELAPPSSIGIIETAVSCAESLRSFGEGLGHDESGEDLELEWQLTVYVNEVTGAGTGIACLGPGDFNLSVGWNQAGGIEWLSLGIGKREWTLRETPDGEIVTDSLNPERMSGSGGKKASEYWEKQQADAADSLAKGTAGRSWICEGCGWPNESGDLACAECGMPAPAGVGEPSQEGDGGHELPQPIEPSAIPGSAPVRLSPGASPDFLGRLGKFAFGALATAVGSALSGSDESKQTSDDPMKKSEASCQACGHQLPEDARFCPHCGAAQKRICPSCGAMCAPDFKFCARCGTPIPSD